MVSADRRSSKTRSALAMRDFAVSPTDADTVLATTEQGLARSTDGGRTWEGVAAPRLVVRGSAGGPPEADVVDRGAGAGAGAGETLLVAVSERGILQSTDGGWTFTARYAG